MSKGDKSRILLWISNFTTRLIDINFCVGVGDMSFWRSRVIKRLNFTIPITTSKCYLKTNVGHLAVPIIINSSHLMYLST